jgi:copper chaperone CopZ
MPITTFTIPTLCNEDAASEVMFELQDLPCITVADVNLAKQEAWAQHTAMISPEEIAAALEEAGHPCTGWSTQD